MGTQWGRIGENPGSTFNLPSTKYLMSPMIKWDIQYTQCMFMDSTGPSEWAWECSILVQETASYFLT